MFPGEGRGHQGSPTVFSTLRDRSQARWLTTGKCSTSGFERVNSPFKNGQRSFPPHTCGIPLHLLFGPVFWLPPPPLSTRLFQWVLPSAPILALRHLGAHLASPAARLRAGVPAPTPPSPGVSLPAFCASRVDTPPPPPTPVSHFKPGCCTSLQIFTNLTLAPSLPEKALWVPHNFLSPYLAPFLLPPGPCKAGEPISPWSGLH